MSEREPVLCYIKNGWAYFTTQQLRDQWGDDWDDAPYQHNAGVPYEWDASSGRERYEIAKVAFDGPFVEPFDRFELSQFSVEAINSGEIAWLCKWESESEFYTANIFAGTTLSEFCRLIREGGGQVYVRAEA